MWKKLLIGAAGGIAGTMAMRLYWKGASKLHGKDPREETRPLQKDIEPIEVLESRKRERESRSGRSGGGMQGAGATAGGLRSVGSTPIQRGGSKTGQSEEAERRAAAQTQRRKASLPVIRPEARYRSDESATEALSRIIYEKIRGREPSDSTKERLSSVIEWSYGAETGTTYAAMRAGVDGADVKGGLVLGGLMWLIGDEFVLPALGLSAGPQKYPLKQHVHRLGSHLAYGVTTAAVTQALWNLVGGENREWRKTIERLRSR